jgi:PAS domain S-box-containing protein
MSYSISQLVDMARVQQLSEAFYAATGIPMSVVNLQGEVIAGSGWQTLCTQFHWLNPRTRVRCMESNAILAGRLSATQKYALHRCLNGLIDAAMPIIVEGETLATMFTGQFFLAPPDLDYFHNQARQFGFDEEAYLAAVTQVPIFEEIRLPAILGYLVQFAEFVAEMGLRQQKQLEAQEALRQSEQQYRLLAENVHDVIWRLDLGEMRFTYISPSIIRLRGYTPEEAMTQSIRDMLDAESFAMIERALPERLRRFYAGDPTAQVQTDVVRQPCKDGTWIWTEMITTLVADPNGQASEVVGVSRNISDRRQVETALRASQDRLEMALRGADLGSFDANLQTHYVFFDHRWAEILGYRGNELEPSTQTWPSLVHPEDWERVNATLERCFRGETALYEAEYRMRTHSGEWKWVLARGKVLERDADGNPIRFSGTHQDITERKHADNALRRMTQRLENIHAIDQSILAAAPLEEICRETAARLRIQMPCERAEIVFSAISAENQSGKHNSTFHQAAADAEAWLLQALQPASESGWVNAQVIADLQKLALPADRLQSLGLEGMRSFLAVSLADNGQRMGSLWLAASAPAVFGSDQVEMVSEVARELVLAARQARLRAEVASRAQELEQRVAARTSQLQTANRELETFAYSVSHDLKAPLRAIEGYARLMIEDYAPHLDEQAQIYLNNIQRASLRLAQLIGDLLEYSRLERRPKSLSRLNPSHLIESIIAERADEISSRPVEIRMDLPQVELTVEIEGFALAMRNLLDNALKFTRDVPIPRIEIGGRDAGNVCLLWVKDNGIGFDMAYYSRVFEVFQRLHRIDEYPGTGIGLAIVRKAMERIGGRVWAESAPGQGATFYLEIPI